MVEWDQPWGLGEGIDPRSYIVNKGPDLTRLEKIIFF